MTKLNPTRIDGLLQETLGEEVVLCDSNADVIHVLNPSAQLIWELCDGQHSLAEMEQAVRGAFSVPAERDVLADIRETLAAFGEKALLIEV